jgi:hypothetical protein
LPKGWVESNEVASLSIPRNSVPFALAGRGSVVFVRHRPSSGGGVAPPKMQSIVMSGSSLS